MATTLHFYITEYECMKHIFQLRVKDLGALATTATTATRTPQNTGLMSKNNRSARAFYVFVHFFAVINKTTT